MASLTRSTGIQHIQEAALLAGIAVIFATVFRRELHLPNAPLVYILSAGCLLAVSASIGFASTIHPTRESPSSRSLACYFVASAGLAFLAMAGYNDFRSNLSYPTRFLFFTTTIFMLFIAPWVVVNYRVSRRSPLLFDAVLPPFFAVPCAQLGAQNPGIELFWSYSFWLFMGIPAVAITYYAIHRRLVSERNTFVPFLAATASLYIILKLIIM